jgi:autotransporter-associated beta strand protein
VATESLEFSGVISGTDAAAGIAKEGAGNLLLSGNNSYTGATDINAGTLLVNGSIAASSLTTVGVNGTLGGDGTVGVLATNGTLAPGQGDGSIQTLKAGNTTWNGGSTWNFDLNNSGSTSDKLDITGDFNKGSAGTFNFNFMTSQPVWNTLFTLAEWTGNTTFVQADFVAATSAAIASLGSGPYNASFFTLNSNSLTFTAIPEPSTALAGVLLGAGLLRRRRR